MLTELPVQAEKGSSVAGVSFLKFTAIDGMTDKQVECTVHKQIMLPHIER